MQPPRMAISLTQPPQKVWWNPSLIVSIKRLEKPMRTVSPDPQEPSSYAPMKNGFSFDEIGPGGFSSTRSIVRVVADGGDSNHSTTPGPQQVGGKTPVCKKRRKVYRKVCFNPKPQKFYSRRECSSAKEEETTWLDLKSLKLSQTRTRHKVKSVSPRVSETIECCLSNSNMDFDTSSQESVELHKILVSQHSCRGLEGSMYPVLKHTRERVVRQVVLMATKMASDNYLDPNTQSMWIAAKSRQLSAGSTRLARHLAEADRAIIANYC